MSAGIRAAGRAVMALRERQTLAPLAYARLWHTDTPRAYSQRGAAQKIAGCTAFALLGGNASGKTRLAAEIAVAVMLGRNDPSVQRWLAANHLDPETVPPYPGRVLFSALTSNDSRKVLREKVRQLLPPGCKWRNEHGDGEAEVRCPTATGNGGVIVFKSNDQGRRAYQADEFDVVILDEEHDSDVTGECRMRIGRRPWRGCYLLLSMTPLKGMTYVYDDFVASPPPGFRYAEVDGRDNPYLDQQGRAMRMAGYGKHERAARESGKFVAMEGRVYDSFSRALHLVPAFTPPAYWLRYAGIDFGTSNPFACVLGAVDPADDTLHILAVHYQAGWTWDRHAEALRAMFDLHGWPEMVWADPEEKNGRMQLAQAGIGNVPAIKDVRPGINAMATRLEPDANGRPHLVLHEGPTMPMVREIEGYVWAPRQGQRDTPDMPLKANDHACFPAGTMVATPAGPRSIESFAADPGPVLAWHDGRIVVSHARGFSTGVRPLIAATDQTGARITATADHPFLDESGAWTRLDALRYLSRCDTVGYARPHCNQPDVSGVERQSVLPLWEVLRERHHGAEAAASCGVGGGAWPAPRRASRPPSERGSGRQQTGESATAHAAAARSGAHDAAAVGSGSGAPRCDTPVGGGVAPKPRGAGVAPPARDSVGDRDWVEAGNDDDLRPVWQPLHRTGDSVDDVLLVIMQNASPSGTQKGRHASAGGVAAGDVRRGNRDGAVPALAGEGRAALSLARIVSVESAGVAETWNLNVPGVSTFILANGEIVHNCDAARYLCFGLARSAEIGASS